MGRGKAGCPGLGLSAVSSAGDDQEGMNAQVLWESGFTQTHTQVCRTNLS